MKETIKVLMFSNSAINTSEIAGSGNWVNSLIKAINCSDINMKVAVAYHDARVKRIEYTQSDVMLLIKIPYYYTGSLFAKILANWMLVDRYRYAERDYLSIIKEINPDLIQIFGLESPFIRIIDKTAQPVIVHIQGLVAPYRYKGYLRVSKFERIKATSLKEIIYYAGLPAIEQKRSDKRLQLERTKYGKVKYFLGRTDWDRRCVKAFSPQAKYFYCQEIMRQPFFEVEWAPTGNTSTRLFTTIRQGPVKNIDIIFEVADILEKYNPDFKYEWYIAGLHPGGKYQKIMQRRGINPKHLHLLSNLPADKIISEMLKSDLFIYPSAIENSSNAVQEAMLVGIPIIATFAGGMSSIIMDGVTGFLVQEGEPYNLAGAILEAWENYGRCIEMSKQARLTARERNKPESVVKSLLEIYQKILASED